MYMVTIKCLYAYYKYLWLYIINIYKLLKWLKIYWVLLINIYKMITCSYEICKRIFILNMAICRERCTFHNVNDHILIMSYKYFWKIDFYKICINANTSKRQFFDFFSHFFSYEISGKLQKSIFHTYCKIFKSFSDKEKRKKYLKKYLYFLGIYFHQQRHEKFTKICLKSFKNM